MTVGSHFQSRSSMYTLSRFAHDDDHDHNIHDDKHSVQAENPRFGKRERGRENLST